MVNPFKKIFFNKISERLKIGLKTVRTHMKFNMPMTIDSQQVCWLLITILLVITGSFVSGYFWGHKKSADTMYTLISRDSLADQVYNSLCTVALNNDSEDTNNDINDSNDNDDSDDADKDDNTNLTVQGNNSNIQVAAGTDNTDAEHGDSDATDQDTSDSNSQNTQKNLDVRTQYYAQLAGFASLRAAEKFVGRASERNIAVLVRERLSHTSKGKSIVWYQVVTENYEDQDALNSVVAILTKEEKLHDVRIVQS